MMKRILILPLLMTVIVFLVGCEAFDGSSKKRERQIQQLNARTLETAKMQEEQVGRFNTSIDSMQGNYATLTSRINELQKNVAVLNQQNQQLTKEIVVLKQAIESERKARETSLEKMAEQVAKETATAINSLKTAYSSRASSSRSGKGPAGSGNFIEYKVQPGATLSAIAKAYEVSIDDIRKANKLNNDIIRTGQTLYIPKK